MIKEFSKEHSFLSNFYPSPILWEGVNWPTVEHAYQAMKSDDSAVRLTFLACKNPGDAKRRGRQIDIRKDWEQVQFFVMKGLIIQKFKQNPELLKSLLLTGEEELQEGNYWNDRIWGISPAGSGKGENLLGKILMDVRAKAKAGTL